MSDGDTGTDDEGGATRFERELRNARALLAADDADAVHVGVVRGGEVETTVARRGDADAGRRALTLLAAHLRTVAGEAGVEPETLAADAASLAAEMGGPDGDGAGGTSDGPDAGRGE